MGYVQLFASNKLTGLAWEILTYLTVHTESNRWQISKELNRSYSGVYNTIKDLLKYNLIQITRTEPSKKNSRIAVGYYGLTNIGLLHILTLRSPSDIDKIAEIHRDKLLYFKKWHLIESDKVKQFIIKEFISALHEVLNYLWSKDYLKSRRPDLHEFDEAKFEEECFRSIDLSITSKFATFAFNILSTNTDLYIGEPNKTLHDARKTVMSLLRDPEFGQYLKTFIENLVEFHIREYNYYKTCLQKISEI